MKKLVIFIIITMFISFNANAQTFEFEISDEQNLYNKIYEEYVSDNIINEIPDDVKNLLNSLDIDSSDPFSLNNLFSKNGLEYIKKYVITKFEFPLKSISILITTILICAICSSLISKKLQANISLNYICVLSVVLIFVAQIISLINDTIYLLNILNNLMLVFIPVYAGILIMSLKSGMSTTFSSLMFFLCEIISNVSNKLILPFSNCFVVLSISSCVSPNSKINGLIQIIKKSCYVLLSLSMALFLSVLTIQSTVSSTVDNTMSKTAKFFISSFVPIIGPALSETLGSFRYCISTLKSTIGIYIVIVIILIFLPKIIEITFYKLIFTICSDVSNMFEVFPIKSILDAFNQSLSILLAVVLCVSMMFVFSITIISIASRSL